MYSRWLQHSLQGFGYMFGSPQHGLGVEVKSPDRGARAATVKAEGERRCLIGRTGFKSSATWTQMSFGALLCSEEAEEEHWFLVYGLVKCFHQKKKKKNSQEIHGAVTGETSVISSPWMYRPVFPLCDQGDPQGVPLTWYNRSEGVRTHPKIISSFLLLCRLEIRMWTAWGWIQNQFS